MGEVDFLVDDYVGFSVLPIEVKSGKDYTVHSALDKFISSPQYNIGKAIVFSNERTVFSRDQTIYMPIYYCVFLQHPSESNETFILDDIELPE